MKVSRIITILSLAGMATFTLALVSCEKTSSPHSWTEPNGSSDSDDGPGNSDDVDGPSQTHLDVETLEAEPYDYSAILYGRIKGNKAPTTVGFQYSYDPDFPKYYTAEVSKSGIGGKYNIEATKLKDLATVFYRAFAVIDGETVYGATRTLETRQGTYQIDGVTYKFIKVTGLPTGSFSIMQTELPSSALFEFEGFAGKSDMNSNGEQTKGEMREFLSQFPFPLRAPTLREWQFAAKGGLLSQGYKYSGSNNADEVAWTSANSDGSARRVAQKQPNELELYDMSGNYAEICANFNDDQLWEMTEKVKKFETDIKETPANVFNISWSGSGGACGGLWSSDPSACTVDSKSTFTATSTTNKYDAKRYCFRFVYSRPD